MKKATPSKKARTATGIEFGDRIVRVATVTCGRTGKVSLRALSQAHVAPGRPGVEEDLRRARIEALREALSHHAKDLGEVVVGIPRDEVVSRVLSLPASNPDEVRDMLFFDVERYLPFPPSEAEISYRVLEQVGANESRIVMVAAPREVLYRTLDDLDEIGIRPKRLDVDSHGCGYVFTRNHGEDEEPYGLFNLDYENSIVGLVVNRQLRFSRSIGEGIGRLEKDHLAVSFDRTAGARPEGEPRSTETSSPSEGPETSDPSNGWPQSQTEWWSGTVKNVKRSLAGFAHEEFGAPPRRLILTGPGSRIPGIVPALEKEIGVPVEAPEPFPPGKTGQPVTFYSAALGLALEQIEGDHRINLIPEEIYRKREAARRKQFLVNSTSLVVVNLLLMGAWVGHAFWNQRQVLEIFESKNREIAPHIRDIKDIEDKLNLISANIDREHSAFKVMKDLFERTTDRVRFDTLDFKKSEEVLLTYETYTGRDVDSYREILMESPHVCGGVERGNQRFRALRGREGLYDVDSIISVSGFKFTICNKESGEPRP